MIQTLSLSEDPNQKEINSFYSYIAQKAQDRVNDYSLEKIDEILTNLSLAREIYAQTDRALFLVIERENKKQR
ncbi:hypothetical protein [Microseira wollei]|nr:hypothetical protein [Microseira wollei]